MLVYGDRRERIPWCTEDVANNAHFTRPELVHTWRTLYLFSVEAAHTVIRHAHIGADKHLPLHLAAAGEELARAANGVVVEGAVVAVREEGAVRGRPLHGYGAHHVHGHNLVRWVE